MFNNKEIQNDKKDDMFIKLSQQNVIRIDKKFKNNLKKELIKKYAKKEIKRENNFFESFFSFWIIQDLRNIWYIASSWLAILLIIPILSFFSMKDDVNYKSIETVFNDELNNNNILTENPINFYNEDDMDLEFYTLIDNVDITLNDSFLEDHLNFDIM